MAGFQMSTEVFWDHETDDVTEVAAISLLFLNA